MEMFEIAMLVAGLIWFWPTRRKFNPKTGSAAVAKERLLWCALHDQPFNRPQGSGRRQSFMIPAWYLKSWGVKPINYETGEFHRTTGVSRHDRPET